MIKSPACCKNGSKSKSDLNKATAFLKLINEPNRLKILCLLKDKEQCVCDIWKTLKIPQNLTSHHLRTLKEAGLITPRQEGRNVIYSSNKPVIQRYASILNNFLISNL